MKNHAWSILVVAAAVLAPLPALAAFRCPAADASAPGDKPTLADDDMAGSNGVVSDKMKAIVHRMLSDGVKSGAVVDRLVVADCRRIDAKPNVSDDDKAEQVRRFASRMARFVYTSPGKSEEDIMLDVPVPTPLYEQLHQAAEKAGVSEDAWVNQAIAAKLGKP